jgi:uncharacterized protein
MTLAVSRAAPVGPQAVVEQRPRNVDPGIVDRGTALASALYEGVVVHRRRTDPPHAFQRSLFLCWLDLDELDRCFDGRWWWSQRRPAPARFRRADFHGDPAVPLATAVRDRVEAEVGWRPDGPVRTLASVRHLGVQFNPLALHCCYDPTGHLLTAVVAEVSNTPWLERHTYVLVPDHPLAPGELARFEHPKAFHVSPFLPMDLTYRWRLRAPDDRWWCEIEACHGETPVFTATMALRRRPWTTRSLARAVVRHPAQTIQVLGGIYTEALRLWRKGARYHPHTEAAPDGCAAAAATSRA